MRKPWQLVDNLAAGNPTGLIRRQEGSRSGFSTLKKAFRLLVEGSDDKPPDDIAYTYSGCAAGLGGVGWLLASRRAVLRPESSAPVPCVMRNST